MVATVETDSGCSSSMVIADAVVDLAVVFCSTWVFTSAAAEPATRTPVSDNTVVMRAFIANIPPDTAQVTTCGQVNHMDCRHKIGQNSIQESSKNHAPSPHGAEQPDFRVRMRG